MSKFSKGYEPVGNKELLEFYLEHYQTSNEWEDWLKELRTIGEEDGNE